MKHHVIAGALGLAGLCPNLAHAGPPDLRVFGMSCPGGFVALEYGSCDIAIINASTQPAGSSTVRLELFGVNKNTLVADCPTPSLGPGQTKVITCGAITPLEVSGEHSAMAIADIYDDVAEWKENNNKGTVPVSVTSAANLALNPQNFVTPAEVVAGEPFTFETEIVNYGETAAVARLHALWSWDWKYDPSDVLVGECVHWLPASTSAQVTCSATVPWGAEGRLVFVVDPYDEVPEYHEGDNYNFSDPITVLTPPNLRVVGTGCPASGTAGQPITCDVVVWNTGDLPASLDIAIGLRNVAGTWWKGQRLADCSHGVISGRTERTVSCTMTLPTSTAGKSGYAWAVVDPDDEVDETAENDNAKYSTLTVP